MRVLFFGTPQFAAESLIALLKSNHTVVGVVTQPDRAVKHGKTEIGAVKKVALSYGLPIFQPERIKAEVGRLKEFGADIGVTAAYGQILTAEALNAFKHGIINVHASLLPKYRGASPIQAAIANGEKITGVTIMRTELGIDTGDILACRPTEIGETETAGELTERLSRLGAELLVNTLDELYTILPIKQDDCAATHCKTISKSEQFLDFSQPAERVVNKIRALSPSPCAKTVIGGEVYKIYCAEKIADCAMHSECGVVLCAKDKLVISCGSGAISVTVIQAAGKRAMPIADFLRGKKLDVGVTCAKQS